VADEGDTATFVPGTVMLAAAETLLFATEVAVSVTERSPAGMLTGAV